MNVSETQEKAVAGGDSGGAVQKCAIIVVIDPGHGDRLKAKNPIDPGAVSGKIYEKDIALDVAKLLRTKLQAKTDVIEAVYLTREGDISEVLPRLRWRVDIAKEKKANIFVSLHLDAASASASGQSTLYHPSYDNSKKLATSIVAQAKVVKSRGAKSRDNLYVINLSRFGKETKASVLIELGFISNDTDRASCQTKGSDIAAEITEGIVSFVNANKAIFSK
ncbi:MAG: N-acetylmuramoyl-L-alanine amidase [Polyangiaceae bacterium]|nr:N-acetylmuramoyl-L-alanine amidase [Polyangiaceae bacterium]